MVQRSELDCGKETRMKLRRDEHNATQLTFPSWSASCFEEGKVSGQLNRCCGVDRDVPEMQLDSSSRTAGIPIA